MKVEFKLFEGVQYAGEENMRWMESVVFTSARGYFNSSLALRYRSFHPSAVLCCFLLER